MCHALGYTLCDTHSPREARDAEGVGTCGGCLCGSGMGSGRRLRGTAGCPGVVVFKLRPGSAAGEVAALAEGVLCARDSSL